MGNNADRNLDRLFAMARAEKIDTTDLEECFETRLMALIAERRTASAPWYMFAWRMVPACSGIAFICAVCSFTFNPVRSSDMFAAITLGQEDRIATSDLLGE
jgi:hypothetical protein